MYNPKGVKPIQIVRQCLFSFKKTEIKNHLQATVLIFKTGYKSG